MLICRRENLPSSFLALKSERWPNPRSNQNCLVDRLPKWCHSTLRRNEDLTRIHEKRRGRILLHKNSGAINKGPEISTGTPQHRWDHKLCVKFVSQVETIETCGMIRLRRQLHYSVSHIGVIYSYLNNASSPYVQKRSFFKVYTRGKVSVYFFEKIDFLGPNPPYHLPLNQPELQKGKG